MAKGIIRKVDELGRITLPVEYRETANISPNDRVGLIFDGQVVHIVILANLEQKYIGMDRPVDGVGRIALPVELRRTLNFAPRQKVDMYVKENEICIEKVGCHFCENTENLIEFKGVSICEKCARELTDQAKEG